MDSSDSGGSMQSSSGGEDHEYHSSPANFLLNKTNTTHSTIRSPLLMTTSHVVGPIPNPPLTHHLHLHQHLSSSSASSSFTFDPFPSYMDLSTSKNYTSSLLNLDMASWSKSLRSEYHSSSNIDHAPASGGFIFSPNQTHDRPSIPVLPLQTSIPEPNTYCNNSNNKNSHHMMGVRNRKKRSRASRRAPTTVLTTDTSNFRAMVQEFTGIPSPPFTSLSFPRGGTSLDLFGTALRSSFSSMDSSQLLAPPHHPFPPYPLRPFPQKIRPPPPFFPPSVSLADAPTVVTKMGNRTPSSPSSSMNLLLSANQQQQQQQYPVVNFQSLLSSSLQFPASNNIGRSSLPDFGLDNGHISSIHGMSSASSSAQETSGLRSDDTNAALTYNASQTQQRDSYINRKVTSNSSSLGFHEGDKDPPPPPPPPDHHHHLHHVGLGTRTSDCTIESWICSSD